MKLLEPCTIGSLAIRNKIFLAPMSLNLTEDGYVTDRMIRFFEERAKGGAGLLIIGDGIVDSPQGNNVKDSTAIDDDRYIPSLKRLTDAVKRHGARIAIQLSHGGRRAGRVNRDGYLDVTRGRIPVAPSELPHPMPGYVVPRELTREEIGQIVGKFGDAAARAVEAGFDAVGLHCAHMYLCGEFLSPWANRRTDEYGGSLERRVRFVAEVLEAMRAGAGAGVPLLVRMNGQEPEGGNSLEEIRRIAAKFEALGVNAISVSVGFGAPIKASGFIPSVAPMRASDGCIVSLAENIKSAVRIPVIVSNKLGTVSDAERIVAEGRADMVALGRPLIADPFLPAKAAANMLDAIVPCIYCGQGCIQNVLERDSAVACTVNPEVAREGEILLLPSDRKKTIAVAGGGPAGMMAARILAQRGHRVVLFEKEARLGGKMRQALVPPGKGNVEMLLRHLEDGLKKAGVDVRAGEAFRPEMAAGVDVVIVAFGGKDAVPPIPGIEKGCVVSAADVLLGNVEVSDPVVIIGGGQVGAEVAEHLAEAGRRVAVVELLGQLAVGMPSIARLPLLCRLEELGVEVLTQAAAKEITDEGVVVAHKGRVSRLPSRTVVIAAGSVPGGAVPEAIRKVVPESYAIGDAAEPGGFLEAIRAAFEIAAKI